jgi:MFS transporter, MCT family, solute carrier family 16 (monocarboxylic acid transporters), member 3
MGSVVGIMIYAWIGVTDRTGMYTFSVLFGLSNGAFQGVFGGAVASLSKDPQKIGTRFGMLASVVAVATLAGPPTAGAIIDKSGGTYLGAQIWGGTAILCGMLTIAAGRWWQTGSKLRVKI